MDGCHWHHAVRWMRDGMAAMRATASARLRSFAWRCREASARGPVYLVSRYVRSTIVSLSDKCCDIEEDASRFSLILSSSALLLSSTQHRNTAFCDTSLYEVESRCAIYCASCLVRQLQPMYAHRSLIVFDQQEHIILFLSAYCS